jgi:hypothetical protein
VKDNTEEVFPSYDMFDQHQKSEGKIPIDRTVVIEAQRHPNRIEPRKPDVASAFDSPNSICGIPTGGKGSEMPNHMVLVGFVGDGGATGIGVQTGKFGDLDGIVGAGAGATTVWYVLGNGSDCRVGS